MNVVSALLHPSIRNIIHTSTGQQTDEVGEWQTLSSEVWAEDATIENNPYGLAKVLAEREIRK